MKNRLRTQFNDEVEDIVEEPVGKEYPDNVITRFFSKGIIDAETVTSALPFLLFLVLLGMIYIANRNFAEKNIRDIDKISRQVKDLSYDYKTTKAELAFKSTLTEVAKQVDTLGIKESLLPPQKITVGEEDVQNDN